MILEYNITTPLMWLTVALLLLGVVLLVRAWRMTVRTNRECGDCGYDLTGIPEDAARCPECGGELATCAITPKGSVTTRRRLRSRGIRCIVASLVAGAVLMLVHPWRLTHTPTWVLANIDLPMIRWRGLHSPRSTFLNGQVWKALNARLLRPSAGRPGFEIDPGATLADRRMQALLDPWFEELVQTDLNSMLMPIRPEFDLWDAGMRAGWWSPEEIGARIGPMPSLEALSLNTIPESDGTEPLAVGVSIDAFHHLNFHITEVELDIDRRTLKLADLPDQPGEPNRGRRMVVGHYRLDGTPGQSTIFTRHASESEGTMRARLVFLSPRSGTPLASQRVSQPVTPSILPTKVRVATGDAVEAISRDLADASVFIPDAENDTSGRIVIATTNPEWAGTSRRDGQALDLVCRLRPSTRTLRTNERIVTEPSTAELPPLPDGRRRFTLRAFEYDAAEAEGRDAAHFGLDSMTWHDILAASEETDSDWDPRTESRFIPFTVSIPSTTP